MLLCNLAISVFLIPPPLPLHLDAEIFSRGVKCPNTTAGRPVNDGEPSMGDAMNITRNPFPSSQTANGPMYGNGRGFCDYSLALPHYDV